MLLRIGIVIPLHIFLSINAFVIQSAINDPLSEIQQGLLNKGKEVCMDELGCFAITDDFVSLKYRPINALPHSRASINTKLLLYTTKNKKEPQRLEANQESITSSNYNPAHPTKFIVHGFMDSDSFGPWMGKLRDEFLMSGEYNIIIVDWSKGNRMPYYQATANTRVVGAEIALLVDALEAHAGKNPEDLHIIGHSLGAHVAGYAGKRLKNLGRITGVDPAEPYFQYMPITVRLDISDAKFVDVIHTDAKSIFLLGQGMEQRIGHVDFFPNNGREQPGCKKDKYLKFILDGLAEGIRRFSGCNHHRAVDFFHYSINYKKAPPVSYQCADYDSFLAGECADCGDDLSKCAILGIRADEYTKKDTGIQDAFYVTTGASEPFWLYHYQVTVKLFKPKSKVNDISANFEVNLHGSVEDFLAKLESNDSSLVHGNKYQFLVTTNKELGQIKSVTLKWTVAKKKLLKKSKMFVQYVAVMPMNVVEKSPRSMNGRVFCDKPDKEIKEKTVTILMKNDKCDMTD